MPKLHAKTVCRRHSWYRFGPRRRRCRNCGRTWRPHPRHRGRKRKRIQTTFAIRYLDRSIGSLRSGATSRRIPRETFRRRFATSLNLLLQRVHFAKPPDTGSLIVIADATGVRILGKPWTIYCLLLRPVATDHAVIVPPVLIPGRAEIQWQQIFARLAPDVHQRITALISDGNPHLVAYGKQQGWVIQRCHFHLKAHVRSYLSWGPESRSRIWGILALLSLNIVLETADTTQCARHQKFLGCLILLLRSKKARWALRSFLRTVDDFRSYLRYPQLRLPATSNAAESLIGLLKAHLARTRGLPTTHAMLRHLFALYQQKQTIHCPPKLQPN